MADVQFDEEEVLISQSNRMGNLSDTRSGLVKLVMNLRLAKTEAQANYVLIGIMLLSFIAMFVVISRYLL
jgi:hypothetical protein